MSGEKVDIKNEPMSFTYEDLMNTELKLIMPSDTYKYNKKYEIYEDMTEDEEYMKKIYNESLNLKIVGVVTAKEGVTSMALNPGVAYTSGLIDYIIDESSKSDIVKHQLENDEIDVLSGNRFDDKKSNLDLDFSDLIEVDSEKLQSAFNININEKDMQNQTKGYMTEIANSISTDTSKAKKDFNNNLNTLANGMFDSIKGEISTNDVEKIVDKYMSGKQASKIMTSLENEYVVPKDVFKKAYSGLLKALLQVYINAYYATNTVIPQNAGDIQSMLPENSEEIISAIQNGNTSVQDSIPDDVKQQMLEQMQKSGTPTAKVDKEMVSTVLNQYTKSAAIEQTSDTMAKAMTEAVMKKTVLTKVGELTANLTKGFATAFNVDQDKISSAFKTKMTEDEITRIVTAMLTETETSAKINLIKFGYQDKEEPTYISFYFRSFDGKEHFKDFINSYNEKVKANGEDDKEINYTDATGILMGSVKTIVNAVTYVLIAFISISLVVSSIMIGIITYISVYERTKEIGILRAIGASKHNISSIFNAETFIIGLLSGLFGIGVTYALIPIINKVLHHFAGNIPLNATFYFNNAIALVILSVILTLIGGLIPARAASKKDPVIALRTE